MRDNIRSEDLFAWDKDYIWHPFTQMRDWLNEENLIIDRGEGNYLIDTRGKRYLDGVASLWVNVHGHCRQEINQAITEQMGKIAHSTLLGLGNTPSIKLAKQLVAITPPGLAKVFYSDSGSTAVEIALKMAFQYWQQKSSGINTLKSEKNKKKTKYISFKNAYHGDTIGAVSVGGMDLFHKIYGPLLFEKLEAQYPYCYRCPLGKKYPGCNLACLGSVKNIIEQNHTETAALIIEPLVQGAGGMITAPPGFLKRVRELCSQYNILLIADEVATGFGRTGKMFACEHEEVSPDIMCLAKGITGGYLPLAVTITTQKIFDAFCDDYASQKTFFHGHTYTGNALGCAAALASLDLFKKDKILEKLTYKVRVFSQCLKVFKGLEHVGDIRQCGLMAGIELVKDRRNKQDYECKEKTGIKVILQARKQGLIIRPLGNVIVLMPPLSITDKELKTLTDITYKSIKTVTE